MTVTLNPYLAFQDEARAAMEFYHSVFGGELRVATFRDFGMSRGPEDAELVMHAYLVTEDGLTLMASDTPPTEERRLRGRDAVALSGGAEDRDRLRTWWEALAAGADVTLPLAPAPWDANGLFGMLTDRYGANWMVSIDGSGA